MNPVPSIAANASYAAMGNATRANRARHAQRTAVNALHQSVGTRFARETKPAKHVRMIAVFALPYVATASANWMNRAKHAQTTAVNVQPDAAIRSALWMRHVRVAP